MAAEAYVVECRRDLLLVSRCLLRLVWSSPINYRDVVLVSSRYIIYFRVAGLDTSPGRNPTLSIEAGFIDIGLHRGYISLSRKVSNERPLGNGSLSRVHAYAHVHIRPRPIIHHTGLSVLLPTPAFLRNAPNAGIEYLAFLPQPATGLTNAPLRGIEESVSRRSHGR